MGGLWRGVGGGGIHAEKIFLTYPYRFVIIKAVIYTAPYLKDKGEHTALYKINK